jgi:hypothetical protein
MTLRGLVYGGPGAGAASVARLAAFCAWVAVVVLVAVHHAVWRDEVRALSFALQGDTVFSMLGALRGEGHPAVWYVLLRGAYAVLGRPEVLQVVAFLVAAAAFLLLVLRAPFSLLVVGLLLLGRAALYEYSVMARNYGISMLLLFLLASAYPACRRRGVALGLLLFLLANSNAHSAMLTGAFLLFWLLDLGFERGADVMPRLRVFALNALVAALGVMLAAWTMYPPKNDAVLIEAQATIARRVMLGVFLPANSFGELVNGFLPAAVTGALPALLWQVALSLLMFGATLGLARRPAALAAALLSLIGFSVFFQVIYPGSYRHEALWLGFLVSLYWLVGRPGDAPPGKICGAAVAVGLACFLALLVVQIPGGVLRAGLVAAGRPESRGRDLARLIGQRPALRDAIVMADPDFLIEPLPYYIDNPTYLPREHRFGKFAVFTTKAMLRLDLAELLSDARALHAGSGQPVIILLHERLDPSAPAEIIPEGYDWQLVTTPEQVRSFLAATRLLERFGPALTDESFDAYLLDGPPG